MGKYISCRKIDKKCFFILISLGIYALVVYIVKIFLPDDLKVRFESNVMMIQLINYIILCFCIIPEIIIKKMGASKQNKNHHINNNLSFKNIMIIIFTLILLLIFDFFEMNFRKFKDNEQFYLTKFYSIFFLTTFIISIFIFNISYYKHQYIPIIIIILLGIIRYIIIIISKKDNFTIKQFFGELFINIIYNICKSFSFGFIKIIMDKIYFSPFKICYLIGFINGFIVLMIYFMLLNVSRDKESSSFSIEYNKKYYYDNILSVFNDYSLGELLLFIYSYSYYPIAFLLFNITIQNYTIGHIFLPYQINAFISNAEEKFNNNAYPKLIILSIYIFMTLVFLEIIELKFWGLNKNTKRNIEIRAIEDSVNSMKKENTLIEIDNYVTKLKDDEKE